MEPGYIITANGLELLRDSLGLSTSPSQTGIHDVLFVSIDFENPSNIRAGSSTQAVQGQLGVAILDTRDLIQSLSSTHIDNLIRTHNFAIGSSSYCAKAGRKFLFGGTTTITQQEIIVKLRSLIPRTRKIILVGHDVRNDLRVLRYLGFDTRTSVLGILDTLRIAGEVIPSHARSLRDVLTDLQCPFDKLHSAGNDAHFTLRALLSLAAQSCEDRPGSEEAQQTVELIRKLAESDIPLKRYPHEKARLKKQRRRERSRKHQAKSWDLETQERIRAERAARRLEESSCLVM